jgi:type IV pilus assembly protein PilE
MNTIEARMTHPAIRPSERGPLRRKVAGVTLIELMVVVIVIATLGVIAIPGYRQYTMRAQRTEAKNALLQLATNQERYYLQFNSYATTAQLAGAGYPTASENNVYTLTVASPNFTQGYTATATPTPGGGINGVDMTTDPDCTSLSITSQGVRTSAPNTDCW